MRYVSDYISLADSIKASNKLNKEEEAADEFHKLFELYKGCDIYINKTS